MKTNQWKFLMLAVAVLTGCQKEDVGKGGATFEITDAAIDDAAVKSVMVTITDVKVNGQSISGFSTTTLDLTAYQKGVTKTLGSMQMDARTYNNITLTLDLDHDVNGGAPGCYVLTQDNAKYKLKSTASGTADVVIARPWSVTSGATSSIVMDFDLRKAISYSSDAAVRYNFVSDNGLSAAVRVIAKEKAGTLKGTYQETQSSNADKVIVYAYTKGTFNSATETQAQGDGILFANAISSAAVEQGLTGKTFMLALLAAGEYELHFASYTQDASGKLVFQSTLASETSVNGTVEGSFMVTGGVTLNLSSTITGF
jgi:hypothetical protein